MKCSLCGAKIGFMETPSSLGDFTICTQCAQMKEQLSEEPQTAKTAVSYFTQCIDNRTAMPAASKLLSDTLAIYHKKFRLWELEQDRLSQLIQNRGILDGKEEDAELRAIRAKIYEQNQSAIENSFLSTSCSTLDGYIIKAQYGIVLCSISHGSAAGEGFGFGSQSRPAPIPSSVKEAIIFDSVRNTEWKFRTALDGLIYKAFLLGCNALVGVRFNSIRLSSDVIEIDAYGTAVVVEKSNSDCSHI